LDGLKAVDLRYRNDLRERNELSHAHLVARMEQQLAGARAELHTELQHLRREIQQVRTELNPARHVLPGLYFGFWIAAVSGATALAIRLR
jgi:hypothetical protein